MDIKKRIDRLAAMLTAGDLRVVLTTGQVVTIPARDLLPLVVDCIESAAGIAEPANKYLDVMRQARPGQPAPVDTLRQMALEVCGCEH